MSTLNNEQQQRAVEVLREYLAAPKNPDGRTPMEVQAELDANRAKLIDAELKPLLLSYLAGQTPLDEFKSRTDGINKRNEYWGFKGIKGQMFFNMIVNTANNPAECDQELKAALAMPTTEEMARSRIRTFASYARRLGETHVEQGGSKYGRPKMGSIPFFLSYFWQIQDRVIWPVYYTNAVNTMSDLNLWQPTDDLADDYITFKHLHEELAELFTKESGKPFDLYGVEHVFWFKGGNPYGGSKPTLVPPNIDLPKPPVINIGDVNTSISRIPESYVPPVVSILSRLIWNEPDLDNAAKASGTSVAKAAEKSIHAAFTILGYEAKPLGQGKGRVPDGLALAQDDLYAILWDSKVRADGYSMGTDDRIIRDYITTQSRDLKKKGHLRNIYYLIVSSQFKEDYDDTVRMLKMETDVNEVCLFTADALVAMVDLKLRDPTQVTLGPDGLQRLFSSSGIVTADDVRETFS